MAEFKYRILVVDDDPAMRTASRAVLAGRGYEVLTCDDGFAALAMMRGALPDLILSDLSMPKMSGFEFLSVVRRRFPSIPVIAVSGSFTGPEIPVWVLADAFIPKGTGTPEQLLQRIAELLEASPLRAQVAKPDKAPVWIPRNGDYFVVTCPDCLRSFSLPTAEFSGKSAVGVHDCIFCEVKLKFVLEPGRGERSERAKGV